MSGESQPYVIGLLDMNGSFTPIWKISSIWLAVNSSSPDGRFVAASGVQMPSEVWLLCEDCPGS